MKLTDMDKVEAWTGAALPVGRHTVRIDDAKESTSAGGYPEFEFEFAGEQGSIRDWLQVTPKTLGKVRQFLDAIGIKPESGEMELSADQLLGRPLMIIVGEEPDNAGKLRRRVTGYTPADNAEATPDDADLPF